MLLMATTKILWHLLKNCCLPKLLLQQLVPKQPPLCRWKPHRRPDYCGHLYHWANAISKHDYASNVWKTDEEWNKFVGG